MLRIENLRHRFASVNQPPVLDIAALEVSAGALTVIAGPSGSGKTTLLYAASGIIRPAEGRVLWYGRDIAALGEARRDRWRLVNAGFVFQNFHLFEDMSPLDNVLVTTHFSGSGGSGLRARAVDLLHRFGIEDLGRRTDSHSRGEQQRIALARALLHDPAVIFADEPTASLDSAGGALVTRHLLGIAGEGKTVIVVSHDPQVAAAAGVTIRLDHGCLAGAAAGVLA